MIASLPMYDRPELAAAHDALWAEIRDRLRADGIDAPDELERRPDVSAAWRSPDLLLGQTCGLPFRAHLHDRVRLVTTPDYGLQGTPPGHYRSLFVTRSGDATDLAAYAGRVLAVSDALSHSGWAAAWIAARDHGFAFAAWRLSGSHRGSARHVADGRADIAAIDAVSWRGIAAFEPDLARGLQVIGRSAASPGLPLVTGRHRDPAPLRRAVRDGIAALAASHRDAFGLRGVVDIGAAAYMAEPIPPGPGCPPTD